MKTSESEVSIGSTVNCSFILADRLLDSELVVPVLITSAVKIDPKFAVVIAMLGSYDLFNPIMERPNLHENSWLESFASKDVEFGFHFGADKYFFNESAKYFTPEQVKAVNEIATEISLHSHDAEEIFNMFYDTEQQLELLPELRENNAELYFFLTKVLEYIEQGKDEGEAFLCINEAFKLLADENTLPEATKLYKVLHLDSNLSEEYQSDSIYKALILADHHKNKKTIVAPLPDLTGKTDEQLKSEYAFHHGSHCIGLNDVAVFQD